MADDRQPGRLIGVDWGTTNARAFLIGEEGEILQRRDSTQGVASLAHQGFAQALCDMIVDWDEAGDLPLFLCGMVGSRQGWAETPYVPCPADAAGLAQAALAAPRARARIVPGMIHRGGDGLTDVMRGEETQVVGATTRMSDGLVLTPGTHGKWITVVGGQIIGFKTFMTGELFALLGEQSLLARSMDGRRGDPEAFALGVTRSLADPSLTSLLFSVRTEGLTGGLRATSLSAYLSGLVIGAEVGGGLRFVGGQPRHATIIAAPALADLYSHALAMAGVHDTRVVDGAMAAARGLWRIASLSKEASS